MPLRNVQPAVPRQPADNGDSAGGFNRCFDRLEMAGASAAVHDYRGNPHTRLQLLKAKHYRRRTAAHAAHIHYKQNGTVGEKRNLCSRAGQCGCFFSIIKPHNPFNHREFSILGGTQEIFQQVAARGHPGIEIACRISCYGSMIGRINIIRAAFEALHLQAAPGKSPHQPQCHRRFARAAAGAGYDEARPVLRLA
ncbi:hypothetical protein D3C75_893180 [compost metagenome]